MNGDIKWRIAQDMPNATTAATTNIASAPTNMKKTTTKMETRRALTLQSELYAIARTKQAMRNIPYVLPTSKLKAQYKKPAIQKYHT